MFSILELLYAQLYLTETRSHVVTSSAETCTVTSHDLTFTTSTVTPQPVVNIWLEAGSIFISLSGPGEEYVELSAKVIIGVKNSKITDIEILLDKKELEKLRTLLSLSP